ncbi:MAG: FeoA family protein [Bacillota bacterium]
MSSLTLKQLNPGQKGIIVDVRGDGILRRRLFEMGLVPGSRVQVERYAPLGDPIEIRMQGYFLTLRKEEAGMVEVACKEEN